MSFEPIVLDGASLTLEQVAAVAYGQPGQPAVALAGAAVARVERAAAAVQQLVARGAVAYGVTTGFGAFKDRPIPLDQVEQLQRNILMSHAVGVGAPFDGPTTRAIMLIRANTLARGHSGIRLATLELLLAMLNAGIHPIIPQKGSLGASGDLAPLAHMALPLIGAGEAELAGERMDGATALRRCGLSPTTLVAKEGLALTNGTAVMCALGVLECLRAELLSQTADIAGCLSLEALSGTDAAFDERIHNLRPFPRQQACAAYLRALLADSELVRRNDPRHVQDAYTLRCIPQIHGAVRDAIAYARWVFAIELNAVTDNPLLFEQEDSDEITVLSGGNFHGEPLAIALDYLAIAMSELGSIAERRIMRLVDASSNGGILPAFLTAEGGLNSGFMIVQYTAAALVTEGKILAHPASVDNIPTSANIEDHVSMGCTAGLKARAIHDLVEQILAAELMSAAQGLDFRQRERATPARLGRGSGAAYAHLRAQIPFIERDCVMYPWLEQARQIVAAGTLVVAVDEALG